MDDHTENQCTAGNDLLVDFGDTGSSSSSSCKEDDNVQTKGLATPTLKASPLFGRFKSMLQGGLRGTDSPFRRGNRQRAVVSNKKEDDTRDQSMCFEHPTRPIRGYEVKFFSTQLSERKEEEGPANVDILEKQQQQNNSLSEISNDLEIEITDSQKISSTTQNRQMEISKDACSICNDILTAETSTSQYPNVFEDSGDKDKNKRMDSATQKAPLKQQPFEPHDLHLPEQSHYDTRSLLKSDPSLFNDTTSSASHVLVGPQTDLSPIRLNHNDSFHSQPSYIKAQTNTSNSTHYPEKNDASCDDMSASISNHSTSSIRSANHDTMHCQLSLKKAQFTPPCDRPKTTKNVKFIDMPDVKGHADEKSSKVELPLKKKKVVVSNRENEAYVKKIIPKSDYEKNIIFNAIKSNILFHMWAGSELLEFVDVFVKFNVGAGEIIFKEGAEGNFFYLIETGSVDVYKKNKRALSISGCGEPFGEVALLYDAPRNATIKTREKCKLWAIHRKAYRGISRFNNEKKADDIIIFLKKVKIGNHILGDVLELSEIYNMALATQTVSFTSGDVIAKEGEKGDIFYIIKSGNVDVFIKACGNQPVITMVSGQFFGEKALSYEDGLRTATCVANSDVVECFTLARSDFSKMLGDVTWMFSKMNNREEQLSYRKAQKEVKTLLSTVANDAKRKETIDLSLKISDFHVIRTIGIGTFGQVKSVKRKIPKQGKSPYYVLKCQDIEFTKENNLVNHLKSEKSIMEQLNHPFIVEFYGEFRDTKYSYFLLELLQGGEVFSLLAEKNRFPEDWSRFYSGAVLAAFAKIHSYNIVYRDLKPENLVLDNTGYPKLIDFGLAKRLEGGKTWTLCGTPDYMPPEVITNEGHDSAVDYWALGILLYEFTNGTPPFASEYPMDVYKLILSGKVDYPKFFSDDLCDLIVKLLNPRQATRIGRIYGGTKQVMDHNWYSTLDFDELIQKRTKVPFVPDLNSDGDMSYFEDYSDYDSEQPTDAINEKRDSDARMILDYSQQPLADSSLKKTEEKKSSTRKITLGGRNRYTKTITDLGLGKRSGNTNLFNSILLNDKKRADSLLIIQLMNLAVKDDTGENEKSHYPFQEFTMLSVKPESLYDLACEEFNSDCEDSHLTQTATFNGSRYVDPIFLKSVDAMEQFPKQTMTNKASLGSEALAAFCIPDGVSIRLLPRCAVEGAKRLRMLGKDSDTYQLHAFTNGTGDRSYGVSITIQEELFCANDKALHNILSYLRLCRKKRRAARIIADCWRKYIESSHFQNSLLSKNKFAFRPGLSFSSEEKPQRQLSFNLIDKVKDSLLPARSQSSPNVIQEVESEDLTKKPAKKFSRHAKRLAAEAYQRMNDDEKGGDVCIIEICYVMVGTKLQDQSLVLNALQKFVDVEREDNAVRRRFCNSLSTTIGISKQEDTPILSDHRNSILKTMQAKLLLSPAQKKISVDSCCSNSFEVDLSLGNASKISLPLPLPNIATQWGFATMIRCIQIPKLLIVLKLLLMERSILFIGCSTEEVTASACAISELLHPYKWASAFMPLLPTSMLDIIDSPVPYIVGMVAKNEQDLNELECDSRVINAKREGLSVINLSSSTFSLTNDPSINSFIQKCYDPVSTELLYYQSKLKGLFKNENSALNCFKTFFESGASHEERMVLESIRKIISNYILSFAGSLGTITGFKNFGVFDQHTNEFDFFPDKFLEPLRAQLAFQETMTCTQMFLSFIEEKKIRLDLLEGSSAIFIATWLCTRWRMYKASKRKQS